MRDEHRAMQATRLLRNLGSAFRGRAGVWLRAGLILAPLALLPSIPQAQDITFFRIGTGSTGGTYFPIGGIIASAISKPPGSRDCDSGGSCGVPGLIAVAQSTEGSVANVLGIAAGELESGFSQADISYWAYKGEGTFAKTGPITSLRTVANLFPESMHLVARVGSGIYSVKDLRGKRVSLDREGSGTRVDGLLVLEAYGVKMQDLKVEAFSLGEAADRLRAGELDAFFMIAGTPANAIVNLADDALITLVPLDGPNADKLRKSYPFFAKDRIPAGTYFNTAATDTLSVGAQWLVSAELPDELIYQITRALWHPSTRRLLDGGHPKGKKIRLETALEGVVVPIHPGARRYYSEAGIPLPPDTD
jgi:uncharacterized protein